MLYHCSAGCGGRSGCGMLLGDGSLPVPRDVGGGAKAHLSQNHGVESRPFFVEGLVCLDSKYCAVKEQMCVLLIDLLRESAPFSLDFGGFSDALSVGKSSLPQTDKAVYGWHVDCPQPSASVEPAVGWVS
ncbi:unnamed protein product [Rangifer tarandus platyrhynchus]|uniref:Uncharacterized protein n=1 Tax=Rangifer tarandus platyrhynchus TaxID=3082113 RepID=A0AC59YLZ0_RANTA